MEPSGPCAGRGNALAFPISPGALTAPEVRQMLGRDDPVILNVGANSGQSAVALMLAMPRSTIYAFEPDPRCIAKFRRYISHPHIHLQPCAVGAANGQVIFHQSSGAEHLRAYRDGWDQSGSIRAPKEHLKTVPWVRFEKQIVVAMVTLDAWAQARQVTAVDFIWADVQGAESDLIHGATRVLRTTSYLYTEYSNTETYAGQANLQDLAEMLPDFELVRRYQWDALFRRSTLALN